MSCGFLLQGIFPTQGSNLRLLCLLLWLGGFFTKVSPAKHDSFNMYSIYLNSSMCNGPEHYWLSFFFLFYLLLNLSMPIFAEHMQWGGNYQIARFQISFSMWKQKTCLFLKKTWNAKYESPFKKRSSFNRKLKKKSLYLAAMYKFLLLRMRITWEDREYSQLYLLKGILRPDSTLKGGRERSSMTAGKHVFPFQIVTLWIDFKKNKICWESESLSVVSDSSRPHGLYSPQNSPG